MPLNHRISELNKRLINVEKRKRLGHLRQANVLATQGYLTRGGRRWSWTNRKAKGACLSATSTRQDGWKIAFYLPDGLTCDLEPMAPGARQ
ncbi:hypothetical protein [Bacillus taeanensis]|uniref:hypothetical protein n=1 Tax=Bacillus taeanensis TaxID=273032 RepID=UPI000DE9E4DE|nr:hypothetical protein [Bacillus taeanensis]